MKNHFTLSLFLVLAGLSACKDNMYSPFYDFDSLGATVDTDSVLILGPESILLRAHLTHAGAGPIHHVGFFYGETLPLDMVENQRRVSDIDQAGQFVWEEANMEPGKQYWVNSFVANEHGLAMGEPVPFEVPLLEPPEVPCQFNRSTLLANGIYWPLQGVTQNSSSPEYRYTIFTLDPQLSLYFQGEPVNRIYQTVSYDQYASSQNDGKEIFVSLNLGFENYSIEPGAEVFVTRQSDGSIQFDICKASYQVNNQTFSLALNASTP